MNQFQPQYQIDSRTVLKGKSSHRANHAACCCLDSKPSAALDVESGVKLHEVAGMANSSLNPNSDLVDVGYDSILEAKEDMEAGPSCMQSTIP